MSQTLLPSSLPQKENLLFKLEPGLAWLAIVGLFGFTTLGAFAGIGTILRVLFPAMSFVVGIYLYRTAPLLYNGFVWWIWFLTPLLRRIADYKSSYDTMSLMLTAPYFVTLISAYPFFKHLPKANRQGTMPFVLAAIGVIYSFGIGMLGNSPITVGRALLDWLPPIFYGFYMATCWRQYPDIRQNTQRIFLWGTLVTGSYGIYQYMVAPEWDRFWLENVKLVSFGLPEPQGIRVWSTMNGPAAFSGTILAGLILLFTYGGQLRAPAAGVGYLAFLLSMVRAAWGAWALGLLMLLSSLKSQLQIRLIITIAILTICVIPLTSIEPFASVINARFESLSNVQEDSSYGARTATYQDNIGIALSQVLGRGLGGTWAVTADGKTERVALDSGILDTFFTLGWFGAIPYLTGMFLLVSTQFQNSDIAKDLFASAARSITLALLIATLLGPFTTGSSGMVFWGFLGISLAAQKYYRYQRISQSQVIKVEILSKKNIVPNE